MQELDQTHVHFAGGGPSYIAEFNIAMESKLPDLPADDNRHNGLEAIGMLEVTKGRGPDYSVELTDSSKKICPEQSD